MKRPTSDVTGFTLVVIVFDRVLLVIHWPSDIFTANLVVSVRVCVDKSSITVAIQGQVGMYSCRR